MSFVFREVSQTARDIHEESKVADFSSVAHRYAYGTQGYIIVYGKEISMVLLDNIIF